MGRLRLVLFAACLPAAALAQDAPSELDGATPEQQAHARFNLGLIHFNLGEYDAAIADFQAGYHLKPLPLFLFNTSH